MVTGKNENPAWAVCHETATRIEQYIESLFFDPMGLMFSGIDAQRNAPFDKEFITPIKVPRRAAADPWGYWSYEDSVMSMGIYLDGQILKYEITGDAGCLEVARRLWKTIDKVYACSQVHGIGSFLRPYGGYEGMSRFMEPLGTDQASPLFSGLYRYLPHASPAERLAIRRLLIQMLEWYERQGFRYFYYKSIIHDYAPGNTLAHHANSYYLPALAWAAREFPGDGRWEAHLNASLEAFRRRGYILYRPGCGQPAFCWGSDLEIAQDILGDRFDETFTPSLLDEAYRNCLSDLAGWGEPDPVRRICPESADPGFEPSVSPDFNPSTGLGFAYFHTRHHGRMRPRHEIDFLIALAAVGHASEAAADNAFSLLSRRVEVPLDFTAFLSEDYDLLPESVHLYARSVGPLMVGWWRNYWFLHRCQRT